MTSTVTQAVQSTLTYHFNYESRFTRKITLRIYHSDEKSVAYTVTSHQTINTSVSNSPSFHVYRGSVQPDSIQTDPHPQHYPIAIAKIPKYSTSISLVVNSHPIEVVLHVTGLWKYAREWKSCRGVMRWKHGRFSSWMILVDENGEKLGEWEPNGNGMKGGRLQFKGTGEEEAAQWEDEVVSVASAIITARRRRGWFGSAQ